MSAATPENEPRDVAGSDPAQVAATAAAAVVAPTGETPPVTAPAPRRTRRRRRLVRTLWIVLAVLLVVRLGVVHGARFALVRVGASFGLDVAVRDLNLIVLGGRVELWDLVVRDSAAPAEIPPLLALEYAGADLDIGQLLRGRIVVERAELDGVELRASLREDGRPDLPEPILALLEASPEPDAADVEETKPSPAEPEAPLDEEALLAPLSFQLPFEVRFARVQEATLFLEDRSVTPHESAQLDLKLRASRLGQIAEPGRIDVYLHSPELLDSFSLWARVRHELDGVEGTFGATAVGLHLAPAARFLALVGIVPEADSLELRARGDFQLGAREAQPHIAEGVLAVTNVAWTADGAEAAALDRFEVGVRSLSRAGLDLERIDLAGVRGRAQRGTDGALRLGGLRFVPVPAGDEPETEPEAEPEAVGGSLLPPGFRFDLGLLALRDFAFDLDDRALEPPLTLELRLESSEAGPLVSEPTPDQERVPLSALLRVPGVVEAVRVEGFVSPYAKRKQLELELDTEGVHPVRLEPYFESSGVESVLEAGRLQGVLEAWFELVPADAGGGFDAGVALSDFLYSDGEQELVAVDQASATGIAVRQEPRHASIGDVELAGTRIGARRDASGALFVAGLRIDPALATPTAVPEPNAPRSASPPDPNAPNAPSPPAGPGTPAVGDTPPDPEPVVQAVTRRRAAAAENESQGLEIGSIAWTGARVEFLDEFLGEPSRFVLEDLTVQLERILLGRASSEPAELLVRFATPGFADEFRIEGSVTPHTEVLGADVALTVDGVGLTLDLFEPYLDTMSIVSKLQDASLHLALGLGTSFEDGILHAEFALSDFLFANAGEELAHLGELRVEGIEIEGGELRVGHVNVRDMEGGARLAEDSVLEVLGLRLEPFQEVEEVPVAPEAQQGIWRRFRVVFGESFPPEIFSSALARTAAVEGVVLHWRDDSLAQPIDLTLRTAARAEGLEAFDRDDPVEFEVQLGVDGVLDELGIRGTFAAEGFRYLAADVDVEGGGLIVGPAADYLPAGLTSVFGPEHAGAFRLGLGARATLEEDGSRTLNAELRDVDLRGAGDETPLFALSRAILDVPRLDFENEQLELGELALEGVRLAVLRTDEKVVEALGWRVDLAAVAPASSEEPAEPLDPTESERGIPYAADLLGRDDYLDDLREVVPTIDIGRFDLGFEELRVEDRSRPEGALPLVTSLRMFTPEPQQLMRPDPQDLEPFRLSIEGAALPLFEGFQLDLTAAVFAPDPRLSAVFDLTGLRGAGATEAFPGLIDHMDGSGLEGGSVSGEVDVYLRARRRGPLEFEFGSGFGLELEARDLALKNGADGTVLAGLDQAFVEVETIRPSTGDVFVRSIELETPRAVVRREAGGIRFLGLLWKLPEVEPELPGEEGSVAAAEPVAPPPPAPAPEATPDADATPEDSLGAAAPTDVAVAAETPPLAPPEEDGQDTETADSVQAVQPVPAPEAVAAAEPGAAAVPAPAQDLTALEANSNAVAGEERTPELRIDRFFVSGLDVLIEDDSRSPVARLPLTDLDIEVRGLTNRLLTEPRTLKFHMALTGGEIELPRRAESNRSMLGLLGGVTSGVTGLVGLSGKPQPGAADAPAPATEELRSALDEVALAGRIAFYPQLEGWTTLDVRGLELANFRGPASAQGIDLEDGVFENSTRLQLQGQAGINVKSTTTLTHMRVSESENGPIRSTLRLPATLETALFVTRNEAGENVLPIEFRVDPNNLSINGIYGAILGTLSKVITESIARSPARVVGGIVDFAGLPSAPPVDLSERSLSLEFAPGAAGLEDSQAKPLNAFLSLLHTSSDVVLRLQHEFGAEDFERVAVLANPNALTVVAMTAHMRQRRAELARRRNLLAVEIRAAYGLGRVKQAEPKLATLRELEVELGLIEKAQDEVLEHLRRGAERRDGRRARDAAMTLAELRLDEARALVASLPFPRIGSLIVVEHPRIKHARTDGPGRVIVTPVRAND